MLEIVDVKERGPKERHNAREIWGRAPGSRAQFGFGEKMSVVIVGAWCSLG